jgi:hypothetical protein
MVMVMVMMVVVVVVVRFNWRRFRWRGFRRFILCPRSDRGKGDGRGQQHRGENCFYHFFLP